MHVSGLTTSQAKKKTFETSKLYTLSNETKYIWVSIFIKKKIYTHMFKHGIDMLPKSV